MRIFAASIILTILTSGAQASSIVTPAAMTGNSGPSVVVFDAPAKAVTASVVEPSSGYTVASPSIVAFGAPGVDDAKVAAIPPAKETKPSRHAPLPMVIRGGTAGEAFARPGSATPPEQAAQESAAPEQTSESTPETPDEQVQDGPVLR